MLEKERNAIEATLAAYVEAWRDGDMERWGRCFTADSDFITWRGIWWSSRDENVAAHKALPIEIVRQTSNYRLRLLKMELLSPSVALVLAEWLWSDFVEAEGAPENRRGMYMMVMVERDGRWRIRALQNTRTQETDGG